MRMCDEALLGHDGYRNLAAIVPTLFRNGAFCSLSILLKVLIPVWKAGENPVIILDDTFFIKLGGDSRNVERKQNHVMVTFCLLNEGDDVLKPDHQFSLCFYVNKEKYEALANVGKLFALQLTDLKENRITDDDSEPKYSKF
ncbi:hypothetical protein C1645_825302 [Glomus cerebriforme]|uniref:Uncharacterized protein n=1 Tax=Glomus cerebriforme TaxID=658196 RepID=A0A397SZ73_9GLOM|nr:hypothetical protein C1645_825302 [Glomus cerebriforme]